MALNENEITERIRALIQPGTRERLIARGLARGLIWRDGKLPPESPAFSRELSTDLLDHGFNVLSLSLQLRELGGDSEVIKQGLYSSAEAIESAVRRGERADLERGFHLTVAATAFHIGGYAARAFSLFEGDLSGLNLASFERAMVLLLRRNFDQLRGICSAWLNNVDNSDRGVVSRLSSEIDFGVDDVIAIALTRLFHKAIAVFEVALLSGRAQYFDNAMEKLRLGLVEAAFANHVPLWWAFRLARHLFDDLWQNSLHQLLPSKGGPSTWPGLRNNLLQLLAARPIAEIDLWPSQIEAASRVLDTDDDLVVALPTSAGKTRIAELCILRSLADGKRVVYVTPLRALSAQIESCLARTFCPLGFTVTSVYGASGVASSDINTLKSADVVVATPEKLDFAIRQDSKAIHDIGLIVLDEGHMIGLSERDIRYEMLLQRLLRRSDAGERRLVCLSAVFAKGEAFDDFTAWLRFDKPGTAIQSTWRPTRQRPAIIEWHSASAKLQIEVEGERPFVPRFVESKEPIKPRRKFFPSDGQELIVASTTEFLALNQSVLIYCPIKKSVEATAKAFLNAEKDGFFKSAIAELNQDKLDDAIRVGNEWLGKNHAAVKCLALGVAVHHGSLPRPFLLEIEILLKKKVLPICICSPTLAQGVDLSFSVLLFRSLYRNGKLIPAKEFANVVGRVGRAFVDLDGIYALPIFEPEAYKSRERKREFQNLIKSARQRQLESGVRLLINSIVRIISERLDIADDKLIEYVTNMQSPWQVEKIDEKDTWPSILQACLNELDSAIFGVVDVLDLSIDKLADYLDRCMEGSYWQRQLRRQDANLRLLHESVVRGRATWLWTRTDERKRRGFFAAGIGFVAGQALESNSPRLKLLLEVSEAGITCNDIETTVNSVIELAKILFEIGPFEPEEQPENWTDLLGNWLRGQALSEFANNEGISFIQGDIVFRLVWAVEAARVHIQHQAGQDDSSDSSNLAICLTYGVPNRVAALFMQAGMNSRTLACKCADRFKNKFSDLIGLSAWVKSINKEIIPVPPFEKSHEQCEWIRFLSRFEHREHSKWRPIRFVLPVDWSTTPPKARTRVRVIVREDQSADVFSVSFKHMGYTKVKQKMATTHFFGLVRQDSKLEVSFFGT